MEKIRILNLDVHNWTFSGFLEQLEKGVVVTPNLDHFMRLQKDRTFYEQYSQCEHIVCDSRIVQLLSKFLYPGKGVVDQIAGSDLFPAYCQYHKDNTEHVKVFLLGGTTAADAQAARDKLNQNAGSNIVVAAYSPPFGFEKSDQELQHIITQVAASGATALAIGVGSPKQENWLFANKDKLPGIKLFFAIGATIDFQAGTAKRAPRWMTKIGMEWFYRMMQEPGRMVKRYLIDDMPFLWLIVKQKFGTYKNPWNRG